MSKLEVRGVSPIGRASYPHLFKAQVQNEGKDNEKKDFSVVLLFPKDSPELAKMKEHASNAAKNKWGDKIPKSMRSPFRDGDERHEEKGNCPEYQGMVYVTFRSSEKPPVVSAAKKEMTDGVYAGSYGRAAYNAAAYDRDGNRGVSFYLNGYQFAKDGERLDSRIDVDQAFDALEEVKTGEDLF